MKTHNLIGLCLLIGTIILLSIIVLIGVNEEIPHDKKVIVHTKDYGDGKVFTNDTTGLDNHLRQFDLSYNLITVHNGGTVVYGTTNIDSAKKHITEYIYK